MTERRKGFLWLALDLALFASIALILDAAFGTGAYLSYFLGFIYAMLISTLLYPKGYGRLLKLSSERQDAEAKKAAQQEVWRMK